MDPEKFDAFISGKGQEILRDLSSKCEALVMLDRHLGSNTGAGNALVLCYNELFKQNSIRAYKSAETFKRAVTSMGFSVVIDEE